MIVNYSDMVRTLTKSGIEIANNITPFEADLLHKAVGLTGEVTELVEAVVNEDRANLIEELGDMEFYFEGLCQSAGATIASKKETTFDFLKVIRDLIIAAGKILDIVKKQVIYKAAAGPAVLVLREALQDFRTTLDCFYSYIGIDRKEALAHNVQKLAVRYENFQYSDKAAKFRADKEGE